MLHASIKILGRSMESGSTCHDPFEIIEKKKKEKKVFQAPLVCVGEEVGRKLLTLNLSKKCCCTIGFLVPGSWGLLGAPGVVVCLC